MKREITFWICVVIATWFAFSYLPKPKTVAAFIELKLNKKLSWKMEESYFDSNGQLSFVWTRQERDGFVSYRYSCDYPKD